jgi:hypothetical protein
MWRLVNGEDSNISESFKTVSGCIFYFLFYQVGGLCNYAPSRA